MALLWLGTTQAMAQKDSLAVESLSLEDSITIDSASLSKALAPKALRKKRNWATWRPDTKRAMWLAQGGTVDCNRILQAQGFYGE